MIIIILVFKKLPRHQDNIILHQWTHIYIHISVSFFLKKPISGGPLILILIIMSWFKKYRHMFSQFPVTPMLTYCLTNCLAFHMLLPVVIDADACFHYKPFQHQLFLHFTNILLAWQLTGYWQIVERDFETVRLRNLLTTLSQHYFHVVRSILILEINHADLTCLFG